VGGAFRLLLRDTVCCSMKWIVGTPLLFLNRACAVRGVGLGLSVVSEKT